MAAVYLPTFTSAGLLNEFPIAFDGLLLLGLLMVNAAFWRTLLASTQRLPYVSLWFFGLALLAFMFAHINRLTTLVCDLFEARPKRAPESSYRRSHRSALAEN